MNRYYFIIIFLLALVSCSKQSNDATTTSVQTGSLASFNIKDNFLLLVDHDRILTYDISNPDSPKYMTQYSDHSNVFETLFIQGDNIFVGTQNAMLIFAMGSAGQLELKGQAQHIRSCDPVVVQDQYAYVTTRTGSVCLGFNQLVIYDVSDIYNPKEMSSYSLTNPFGLAINGNYLYVCDLVDGLVIMDVSEKTNPKIITKIESAQKPKDIIILSETEMMVLNEAYISFYDISAPSLPVFKYKYE